MNKVITINLSGKAYQLEEDGYVLLKNYLEEAEAKLSSDPDKIEILKDFEQAIADKSSKFLHKEKTVVTKSEIEAIIKEMGPVETDKSEKTESKTEAKKKLYRDPDNVMIAGVASGLAAYFGVDITLMRIILAVTIFFWGGGIVLYILLWLLIPLAESPSEKLEMRGDKVTFSNLEETVKEKLNEPGSKLANVFSKSFSIIIRLINVLFKFGLAIIGGFTAFGATIAAVSVTMFTAVLLFNRNSPYIDPAISEIFTGGIYYLILISAYLAVIIPLIVLVVIGVSMTRNKNMFKTSHIIGIIVLWFVAAMTFLPLVFKHAPQIEAAANATYPTVTRELDLKDFDQIDVGSRFIVNITPGNTYSVKLSGEEKYLNDAEVRVNSERTLVTSTRDRFVICLFCFNRPQTLDITMPTLVGVEGSGASQIKTGEFMTDEFALDLSGASTAELNLTVKNLRAELSGASNLNISGTTDRLTADLSGASQFNGRNFQSKSAFVKSSGASDAYLSVSENLEVDASGASSVHYSGNPQTKINSSGGSDVEKF